MKRAPGIQDFRIRDTCNGLGFFLNHIVKTAGTVLSLRYTHGIQHIDVRDTEVYF